MVQGESTAVSEKDSRDLYLERVLASYRRYYNIIPAAELLSGADGLLCRCDFDVRSAQYILSKKHELWSADSHEYCYIFSLPSLTEEAYREAEHYVYEEGMKLIHPAKGQMCTTLTLLIVSDSAEPEAVRLLKKCRLHKNFRFTLDGWMDFHTGLAVLGSGQTACNFGGHDNEKLLRQLLKTRAT